MTKASIGPILCFSGGIASILSYIYYCNYSHYWCTYPTYYILPITGILAFIGLIIRYKIKRVGNIICLIAGLIYPIFLLTLMLPYGFFILFRFTLSLLFLQIPLWLLLIGGILTYYFWQIETKRVNFNENDFDQ